MKKVKRSKKTILYTLSIISLLLVLIHCSDKTKKLFIYDGDVRIEYSGCTGCYKCLDTFECPADAIQKDSLRLTVYIDPDKCTQCMKCIDMFSCQDNAITVKRDIIPPSDIKDFYVCSDSAGMLEIQFTAPGDDSTLGRAYSYELAVTSNKNSLIDGFNVPIPAESESPEYWKIYNLPYQQQVDVTLVAYDDAGNTSGMVQRSVTIANIDTIPPAPIVDLTPLPQLETVELQWTAPGDDGDQGTASYYEIRISESAINDENWDSAMVLDNPPIPEEAYTQQEYIVESLVQDVTYYFAIKSFDESGNVSMLSNCPHSEIIGDTIPPGEITDLSVTSVGTENIYIRWTAPGDDGNGGTVSSYIIKISTSEITQNNWDVIPEYPNSLTPHIAGTTESFFIEGLHADTQYFIAIKAIDEGGNISEISNVATATTQEIPDNNPPDQITDLAAEATEESVILTWTAPGDDGMTGTAQLYDIRYGIDPLNDSNWSSAQKCNDEPAPLESGTAQEFIVSNLDQETTYYFGIKTTDDNNNTSELSNVVSSILIMDTTPPAAIDDLTDTDISSSSILITWSAVGDDGYAGKATTYMVKIDTIEISEQNWSSVQEYPHNMIPLQAGEEESLLLSQLLAETTYHIGIKTFDEMENASALSNVITVTTTTIPDTIPPSTITDLSLTSADEEISLTWSAPGDDGDEGRAAQYELRRNTEFITDGNWAASEILTNISLPADPGSTESYTVSDAVPGQDYYFGIKTIDDAGNVSGLSNIAFGQITGDITPPSSVTDLSLSNVTYQSMQLSWSAVGDDGTTGTASGYIVKIHTEDINEQNWDSIQEYSQTMSPQSSGSQEVLLIEALEPETEYFAAIKVFDDEQNISGLSNVPSATTLEEPDTTPPSAITDLDTEASETDITLSWAAPGDDGNSGTAAYYEIRLSEDMIDEDNWQNATLLSDLPAPLPAETAQSYQVTGLTSSVVYYFGIKTFDDAMNASELSNIVFDMLEEDTTQPAQITDLSVNSGYVACNSSMTISWTAPGDDGNVGTASSYEIRYSTDPIDSLNWNSAQVYDYPPTPQVSGTTQSCTITGLTAGTVYYFAIKACDDNNNIASVSNSPGGKIVYQIDSGPCNGCGRCVYHCPEGAITSHGSYASIDPDLCEACGDCVNWCNRNAIRLYVVSYEWK